ncbi:UNVERIFIED_CONTAM: hypothetical protein K2H54_075934 [Gekko kuhli]
MERQMEESNPVLMGKDSDDSPLSPTSDYAPLSATSPREPGDGPSTFNSPRRSSGIRLPKLYCVLGPCNGGALSGLRRAPPFRFENTRGSVVWETRVENIRKVFVRKWVHGGREWKEEPARLVHAYKNVEEIWQAEEPTYHPGYPGHGWRPY